MFKNKTVFIIGAGASQEAGFPVGTELAEIISKKLNFEIDLNQLKNGHPGVYRTLENYAKKKNLNINSFIEAGIQISEGIFLGETIDNFIDNHQQNSAIATCGKTAIIHSILEAENNSLLYQDPNEPEKKLDQKKLSDTWYVGFAKILFNQVKREEVNSLFNNISIICFNYDRCIQHYLINAIASHYLLPKSESQKIVQRLKIYHPYGSIGSIFQNHLETCVPFGQKPGYLDLLPLVNSIKTYSEQIEDNETIKNIRHDVNEAETIVFLGFGFHPQNLDLLSPPPSQNTALNSKRVFATGFEISDFNLQKISDNIASRFHISTNPSNPFHNSIHIKNLKCSTLFSEFKFGLRAG